MDFYLGHGVHGITLLGIMGEAPKLIEAESFEQFCQTKYTGTKRFGLEGGEAMVPALEQIIKRGGQLGVKEIVIGMPHRGRMNVLANVMAKPLRAIFNEFKGGSFKPNEVEGSGDVKYHLGASSDREFDGNVVHLSLTANPSHLEIVGPVVEGSVRARQDRRNDAGRSHQAEDHNRDQSHFQHMPRMSISPYCVLLRFCQHAATFTRHRYPWAGFCSFVPVIDLSRSTI